MFVVVVGLDNKEKLDSRLQSGRLLGKEQVRKRLMDLQNELMVAGEEMIVREFGMDINTLLFLKWIISKDLL